MKAEFPKPVHESYQRHRRQLTGQIIVPVVLAAIFCLVAVVLVNLATFRGGGDTARWAAISTMWIAIPVMILGLVFLAVLSGIIYLLTRLLGIAPTYTSKTQDIVQRIGVRIRQAADLTVRPVIFLDGVGASIKTFLGRK